MELSFDQFLAFVNLIIDSNHSPDDIQTANDAIYQLREQNSQLFLMYSAQIILIQDASDAQVAIGINLFKSIFRTTRVFSVEPLTKLWASLPEDQRTLLKQFLLLKIKSPKEEIRNSVSPLILFIAQIEYPLQWPDFFDKLTQLTQEESCTSSTLIGITKILSDAFLSSSFIRPRYTQERKKAFQFINELICQIFQQDSSNELKSFSLLLFTNSFRSTFSRDYIRNSNTLKQFLNFSNQILILLMIIFIL